MPELEPRIFSFNSPHGACERCTGLGVADGDRPGARRARPDAHRSATARSRRGRRARRSTTSRSRWRSPTQYDVDLDAPWQDLPPEHRDLFLHGTDGERVLVTYKNRYGRKRSYATALRGHRPEPRAPLPRDRLRQMREKIEEFMAVVPCPACKGARLRPESRAVLVGGMAIHEFTALSVRRRARLARRGRADRDRAADRAARSCARSRSGCASWTTSGSATCRWIARRPRCPAARRSASGWRRRSARRSSACSTSSTSRRSACTSATTSA